jgi:hypothetical protein
MALETGKEHCLLPGNGRDGGTISGRQIRSGVIQSSLTNLHNDPGYRYAQQPGSRPRSVTPLRPILQLARMLRLSFGLVHLINLAAVF